MRVPGMRSSLFPVAARRPAANKVGHALPFVRLALLLLALLLAPAAPARAQEPPRTFLPLVSMGIPPPTIYGTVTLNGRPIAGIPVDLYKYEAMLGLVVATVKTDAAGHYRFASVAPLMPGAFYFAYTDGNATVDSDGDLTRAHCTTRWVTGVRNGDRLHLADFDIAPVRLDSPADGAYVHVPALFRWQRRPGCPLDNYTLSLVYYGVDSYEYFRRNLGYVDTATLTAEDVESSLAYGQALYWAVWTETDFVKCDSQTRPQVVFVP